MENRFGRIVRLVAVLALALCIASQPAPGAKTKPVPCPGGRYLLQGKFLVIGPGNPNVDAVIMSGKNIATGSGCSVVVGKVRATKKATFIKAKFRSCRNVKGKATLNAKITDNCATMNGVFNAHGSHINQRQFSARLSTCGDGFVDTEGGEQCEATDDHACPGQCNVAGACLCPAGTTTSTTVPGGTTTTTTLPKPDLVPTAFSLPAGNTVQAGAQVSVQWTVKNQGTAAASPTWYDDVYLSDDNILTPQDRYLTQLAHSSTLAVSSTYDASASITIPQLPAGPYYLFMTADGFSPGYLSETNEANNVATPIQITVVTPDLTPTAFTLPGGTTVSAGAQAALQWTVKNQGTGPAVPTWYDYVYFSEDAILTQQDQYLGYAPHSSTLAANGTYNGSLSVTIPQKPPGTYYLFLAVDGFAPGSLYEGGADDNNFAGPIAITIVAPDLTPTAFTLPGGTTVSAGAQAALQWTVKNQGTGPAAPTWYDYVYFSEDDVLTPQDQYLGYAPHSSTLAANGTYNGSLSVTIPQKPPGTYYLFLAVDGFAPGSLYEGGADDNNFAGPIAITIVAPDLTPTAFTLPGGATVSAGAQAALQWTVKNQGTGPAAPTWYDYVYFSEDDILTPQDQYLAYTAHSSTLLANNTYNGSASVTVPQKPAGTYYLFLAVDGFAPGGVYEGGADDNNFAGPIAITIRTPDLVPTAFGVVGGTTLTRGNAYTATYTVKNQGTGPAAPTWYDYVYLSTDNVLTSSDQYLAYKPHSSTLAANGTYSDNMSITIPNDANHPPGTYYLFFLSDGFGQSTVYEGGADDNNASDPLQITVQ